MQGVVLLHNEIRFVSLILETLEVKQSFVQVRRRFPSFVIRRRLEVNSPPISNMGSHFLLELLAGSELQTRHQLVLVVGNQKEVLRPTLLQVVTLRQNASHPPARAAHERNLLAVETHLVRWNDNRLI